MLMEVKGWIPVNPPNESQTLFTEGVSGNMPSHGEAKMHPNPRRRPLCHCNNTAVTAVEVTTWLVLMINANKGLTVQQICPEPVQSSLETHHVLLEHTSTSHTESLVFLCITKTHEYLFVTAGRGHD